MKMAEIIPSHKKEHRRKKEKYRPVSILPSISKSFEKSMHEEINLYMSDKLSQFSFRGKIFIPSIKKVQ